MPLPPTTTPPGRTAPCPTAPPRPPPTPPGPKPPPATAPPTPTTASAPTPSAKPAPSPSATRAASTTSASAGPTPEPTSCCSSKTSTSGSSTPPPANYSASSPWIPAATTSPPGGHPGPRPEHPAKADTPNPDVGSGCPRCLETSHGAPGRIRTCDRLLRRRSQLLLWPVPWLVSGRKHVSFIYREFPWSPIRSGTYRAHGSGGRRCGRRICALASRDAAGARADSEDRSAYV